MSQVGGGGIRFARFAASKRFEKEYRKLGSTLQAVVDRKLLDLLKNPFPPGLDFEKLKGYSSPDIYTVHVTGNYKISVESKNVEIVVEGKTVTAQLAYLRRIGTHNEIDRAP